jgi:hypothetical protein
LVSAAKKARNLRLSHDRGQFMGWCSSLQRDRYGAKIETGKVAHQKISAGKPQNAHPVVSVTDSGVFEAPSASGDSLPKISVGNVPKGRFASLFSRGEGCVRRRFGPETNGRSIPVLPASFLKKVDTRATSVVD